MGNPRAWALVFSIALAGPAMAAKPTAAGVSSPNPSLSAPGLSPAQAKQLAAARAQHLKARAALSPEQQARLDRVAHAVKGRLLADLPEGDLLMAATQRVRETLPGLDDAEAEGVAGYVLGAIASGGQRNAEMQMSFNLQYLQLLSQMQAVNRDYEGLSAVLEAKHDAVENSIGNVR